jgi:hypothetical protein
MTKGVSRSAKRCEAFCAAAMTLMWGRVMALSPEKMLAVHALIKACDEKFRAIARAWTVP